MSDPDFLRLDALTLAYGANVAVPSLDLALAEGELVALLGPSGCGKTTTMRAIAGLLAPQGGRIHLAGRDITRVPANKRDVGLVFQSYALFPHLSVFDNVAFGLKLRRLPRQPPCPLRRAPRSSPPTKARSDLRPRPSKR